MHDDAFARQVIRGWARDAAAFVHVLAEQDHSWGSEAHQLAGGWLVLSGVGLYVNVAVGVGVDEPIGDDDMEVIVARSEALGLTPAVEVTDLTHGGTIERLVARGFRHHADRDVTAFARDTVTSVGAGTDGIVVHPVRSLGQLAEWQEVSALGWGHHSPEARTAADAFALAAHAIDGDGMVIARAVDDGRPLGCASLTVRHGVATLGGMSTVPSERGRGVQAALIHHRLDIAHRNGFEAATSRAMTGGASARNLMRHGFAPLLTIRTFTLVPDDVR